MTDVEQKLLKERFRLLRQAADNLLGLLFDLLTREEMEEEWQVKEYLKLEKALVKKYGPLEP